MDNFHIDLSNDKNLVEAMTIAFRGYKAVGYAVIPEKGMVFFWMECPEAPGYTSLPFKMDAKGAAEFALRWLAEADYGRQPDHDGDNGKGWRLYTDSWGRIAPWHRSIAAVQPCWAEYGK